MLTTIKKVFINLTNNVYTPDKSISYKNHVLTSHRSQQTLAKRKPKSRYLANRIRDPVHTRAKLVPY